MIATRTIWRWRKCTRHDDCDRHGWIEVTNAGERCDWIAPDHAYAQLGWAVPV